MRFAAIAIRLEANASRLEGMLFPASNLVQQLVGDNWLVAIGGWELVGDNWVMTNG